MIFTSLVSCVDLNKKLVHLFDRRSSLVKLITGSANIVIEVNEEVETYSLHEDEL